MEESTLRWPTEKEREEMEEVCSIGEVPHVWTISVPLNARWIRVEYRFDLSDTSCHGYDLSGIVELLPNRHCESRLILLRRHVRSQTEASIDRHSSRRISSLTLTKSNRE